MKPTLTLLLCAVLLGSARAQTYFYIDAIAVQPTPTSDQDNVSVALTGGLSSTGAYVVSASATVVGSVVTISIAAADDGGATVIVPHTEVVPIGQLDAGDYTIVIDGQNVGDFAPGPQHQFTVSGGGSPCDSLELVSVRWHPFSDTALVVHVINGNTIGELFDYPNFILFDASGDTLAKETVNFFGIGGESYHTMRIMDGVTFPVNTFSATLELWTGFTTSLACTWELEVDLCPPAPCTTLIPNIQNLGGAITTGTFNWGILSNSVVVVSGSFVLDAENQYDADTICLPPGVYTMLAGSDGGPLSGQPYYSAVVPGGFSTASTPVGDLVPEPLAFRFYEPCFDPTQSVGSANEIADLTLLSGAGEFTLVHAQGVLGEIRVFDSTGRMVHRSSSTADRTVIGTQGWPNGIYSVVVAAPKGIELSIRTYVHRP
jgi:hypothetical protein